MSVHEVKTRSWASTAFGSSDAWAHRNSTLGTKNLGGKTDFGGFDLDLQDGLTVGQLSPRRVAHLLENAETSLVRTNQTTTVGQSSSKDPWVVALQQLHGCNSPGLWSLATPTGWIGWAADGLKEKWLPLSAELADLSDNTKKLLARHGAIALQAKLPAFMRNAGNLLVLEFMTETFLAHCKPKPASSGDVDVDTPDTPTTNPEKPVVIPEPTAAAIKAWASPYLKLANSHPQVVTAAFIRKVKALADQHERQEANKDVVNLPQTTHDLLWMAEQYSRHMANAPIHIQTEFYNSLQKAPATGIVVDILPESFVTGKKTRANDGRVVPWLGAALSYDFNALSRGKKIQLGVYGERKIEQLEFRKSIGWGESPYNLQVVTAHLQKLCDRGASTDEIAQAWQSYLQTFFTHAGSLAYIGHGLARSTNAQRILDDCLSARDLYRLLDCQGFAYLTTHVFENLQINGKQRFEATYACTDKHIITAVKDSHTGEAFLVNNRDASEPIKTKSFYSKEFLYETGKNIDWGSANLFVLGESEPLISAARWLNVAGIYDGESYVGQFNLTDLFAKVALKQLGDIDGLKSIDERAFYDRWLPKRAGRK